MKKKLRMLAIYLPQYHPIKENDAWWGKGFTEWRNVVKGKPLKKGHYQPHLPSDLGFYDLRLNETREEQAKMAKEYGIYGFVYYHYWFNGQLMLEKPLQEVIRLQSPDMPFCICWANENWSRRWDGNEKEMLMQQNYSDADNKAHIKYLCENIFNDKRYICIDNKPVFILYKPDEIPNLGPTIDLWNQVAKEYNFDGLYMMAFTREYELVEHPGANKINAYAEFSPFAKRLKPKRSIIDRGLAKLGVPPITIDQKNSFFDYKEFVDSPNTDRTKFNKTLYPCVTPMWDNSVRRRKGNAFVYFGSTPQLYQQWLQSVCDNAAPANESENFVFINAWNEWAEGNHLEPCEKWGRQYLEATKAVADQFK